ncbi:MAG: WhiB family transcriptional regulator [Acidimicrobiia bacterium]|nr:WhiB family transcriptional regulator [Acidimicrobiia bacterium]
MFYSNKDSPLTAAAKRVCASCSVSEQCLAWAEANGEQGVWGGKMFDRPDRAR